MKTSKEIQVGISALTLIKNSNSPISAGLLAEKVGTTTAFIGQVMKKLRKSELVLSKHGPGGGYIFNTERTEVSAYDVAVALDYEFAPFIVRGSPEAAERLDGEIIDAFMRTKI